MTNEERINEYRNERLAFWTARANMNDMAVAAVMAEIMKKEVAAFTKELSSARQVELDRATDLFKKYLVPELKRAGLTTDKGWSFSVSKDYDDRQNDITVGRLGVRRTKAGVEE